MCTGIVETSEVSGSGKGPNGWFKLERVNVSYDHPTDAPMEHALNIDFVNQKEGPSARVAVELSPESARKLAQAILTALSQVALAVSDSPSRTSYADSLPQVRRKSLFNPKSSLDYMDRFRLAKQVGCCFIISGSGFCLVLCYGRCCRSSNLAYPL